MQMVHGRYFAEKHWLANNVLGLAFSVQGIEHLSLGAVSTGVILLSGLFFYDIFWVFCTPVMVSVVSCKNTQHSRRSPAIHAVDFLPCKSVQLSVQHSLHVTIAIVVLCCLLRLLKVCMALA